MKAILPLLLAAALLHAEAPSPAAAAPVPAVAEAKPHAEPAEPKPHAESAESAESGSPAGGAGERSEPEGVTHAEPAGNAETKPHAEPAESGSPAGGAGERSETEGVPHAEPAENAEPAITGGASSPSEPTPARRGCRAQRPPLRAEVSLIDGSILQGALRPRFLPARSPSLGEFRIDLAKVERIDFIPPDSPAGPSAGGARSGRREGARGAAEPGRGATSQSRIAFRNGDRLTVRFPDDLRFLPFDTLLGRVRLPLRAVSSISFNPSTPSTSSTLIYHCTFDSASSIARPAAGPAGRLLGGEFVPGMKGNALRTFADQPAAEVDFEPGILGPRGTIEFWAKREEQAAFAAREGNLRFFGLWLHERGETPPWCSTHMQFTSNDGMGMSGLCGMINHCSWATNPFFGHGAYDAIQDDPFGWHHYAVAWDADGLPGTKAPDGGAAVVAVYLDGKPLSTQGRQTIAFGAKHLKAIPGRFAKLAFPTPSNGWGSSGGHIPFLIDEFKIWSAPMTEFAR